MLNRGNLQHDLFITAGARRVFVRVTGEACGKFGWKMHAYVVMRNHFRFALETPEPNLVAGMHWLQSTFALRLPRFHRQHGNLLQGRYQSPLIEDDTHLTRVCDSIHLNPVRAGIVPGDYLGRFESGSFAAWLGGTAPPWLEAHALLAATDCANRSDPWAGYKGHLVAVAPGGRMTTGWSAAPSRGAGPSAPRRGAGPWRASTRSSSSPLGLRGRRYGKCGSRGGSGGGRPPSGRVVVLRRNWLPPRRAPLGSGRWRDSIQDAVAPPYAWLAVNLWMGQPSSVRAYVRVAN